MKYAVLETNHAPDWLTYLFQTRQIGMDWNQMKWMLTYCCAEWDWVVQTLDYQLFFPDLKYDQYCIDLTIDPQPN